MTLYVQSSGFSERQWHIGGGLLRNAVVVEHVQSIQADGDELDYISDKFGIAALVPRGERVVRYYGDQARFIVGNL